MEDPAKKRAHSVPSNYVTLQQLQERRLREQKQREEEEEERLRQLQKQRQEEEEEEKRQRQLQKQREEEEKRRNRQHRKSVQSQIIKATGCAEKKISTGGDETLAIEGEIKGQEGRVENSSKGKKHTRKAKGKRGLCVGKGKREEGSAGSDHGEIVQRLASMNVSGHGEVDGVDGSSEKSTDGKRRVRWRAKTFRRVTTVEGEKTTEMNGSERNFTDGKGRRSGRMKGVGRRPEGFDGPDGSDERSEKKPLVKANREDEAAGKSEDTRIEEVLDGSVESDERSTAENKGASPAKKPEVVAAEMGGKPYGTNAAYARSMAETRSNCPRSGGRRWGGMRGGFREKCFHRRPAAKDQVWVRKEEIPDAPPKAMAGVRGEVNTSKPPVYRRDRGCLKDQAGN